MRKKLIIGKLITFIISLNFVNKKERCKQCCCQAELKMILVDVSAQENFKDTSSSANLAMEKYLIIFIRYKITSV